MRLIVLFAIALLLFGCVAEEEVRPEENATPAIQPNITEPQIVVPEENISANITIPEANITANLTMPNITPNATANVTENKTLDSGPETANLSGILFGDGDYLLVLEDISTPDSCALMSVVFAANQSEITKLKGCPGEDVNWVGPEGRVFRIRIIKTAAGYTYAEKWASVIIYG